VLIETDSQRLVLKQSLAKLRVKEDWFSDRDRIFREAAALERLSAVLPAGSIPGVLFTDRENFAFAMTAAPPGAVSWKELLLRGEISIATAEAVATIHGRMIGATWHESSWAKEFGDIAVFDQLRLDPYYRFTAYRHPNLGPAFDRALARSRSAECLVHGDWSPKNMMVAGSSVMAIDFEVVHYGDPAFDVAFMMNHFLLKLFHTPNYAAQFAAIANAYVTTLSKLLPRGAGWLEQGAIEHLAPLLLARIDGKSPVEYIRDASTADRVRRFARVLIAEPEPTLERIFQRAVAWV
jgi:aminoglycoside phosphotransferase (APT) family kinase protein